MKARVALATLPLLLALVPAAHADSPPTFAPAATLPGSGGAEPSLAIDTSTGPHADAIYVTGISPGANVWHSYDGGKTWSQPVPIDTNGTSRGGDDDVDVGPDGTVYAVDLDLTHNLVQSSTDGGQTFSSGTVTAPESDRPWITAGPNKSVYVAYHDFAGEVPVVCVSHDGGATFATCSDAAQGAAAAQCAENTDVSKKLRIDPTDGSLNFMFECSTAQENAQTPPYGPVHDFYLAKSKDDGVTWTVFPVYLADTSNGKQPSLANFWTSLAIDSAGNYYALMDGTMDDRDAFANPFHVWLLTSTDHGQTWRQQPVIVDHEPNGNGTHVLSDIMATAPGQVDIVYYGTEVTGEPNGVCGDFAAQGPCPNNSGLPKYDQPGAPAWKVEMAQSFNALDPTPTFTRTPVTQDPTHYGEICTNGLVCNQSDRSLLDYISVGVDCQGLAHVAFAGNPGETAANESTQVYEVNQSGGSALTPPSSCGSASAALPETSLPSGLPLAGAAAAAAVVVLTARRRRRRT